MTLLDLDHVIVRYGQAVAVDGVSLSVGEDINDLLRFLALHPVTRFELDAPGLEDVFIALTRRGHGA